MEESAGNRFAAAGPRLAMERRGRIEDMYRSFDIEFWQAQDTAARFHAAWELVEHYLRRRGRYPDEHRLQRSVEAFGKLER